jgi:hypothetical protein
MWGILVKISPQYPLFVARWYEVVLEMKAMTYYSVEHTSWMWIHVSLILPIIQITWLSYILLHDLLTCTSGASISLLYRFTHVIQCKWHQTFKYLIWACTLSMYITPILFYYIVVFDRCIHPHGAEKRFCNIWGFIYILDCCNYHQRSSTSQ